MAISFVSLFCRVDACRVHISACRSCLLPSTPCKASCVRIHIPWKALCVTYLCALVHPSQSRTPRPPSSFLPGERRVALSRVAAPLLALQPLSLCLMTVWWSLWCVNRLSFAYCVLVTFFSM